MEGMQMRVGVDIGGTNLRVALVEGTKIIDEYRCHADFSEICRTHTPSAAWQRIVDLTMDAIHKVLRPGVASIGIGFPGFIDPNRGAIFSSPNLPGLNEVDLAGDLKKALAHPVIVENDANAAAFGEYKMCPQPTSSLIYIGLGTGVGGGLILDDILITGEHGFAMEIGHLIIEPHGRLCGCGNRGCLEQYASASGVCISYTEMTGRRISAEEIAKLAQQDDGAAKDAFRLAGEKLAQALAHVLKVIDVRNVIVGGGMSRSWFLMQESFQHRLAQDITPVLRDRVVIRLSESHDHAGVVGAAALSALYTNNSIGAVVDKLE